MGMDVGINIFGISEKDDNYEKMFAAFKGVEYLIDITKILKHIKKIKVHAFYW